LGQLFNSLRLYDSTYHSLAVHLRAVYGKGEVWHFSAASTPAFNSICMFFVLFQKLLGKRRAIFGPLFVKTFVMSVTGYRLRQTMTVVLDAFAIGGFSKYGEATNVPMTIRIRSLLSD
jgi:hypothetical protein